MLHPILARRLRQAGFEPLPANGVRRTDFWTLNLNAELFPMSYFMDFQITMALLILGLGALVLVVRRWINRQ